MALSNTAAETRENDEYLSAQLITYIGNKRSLLDFIGEGVEAVLARTGKKKARCFDVFSGSGVVSRYLKRYSSFLVSCDLERYAEIIGTCYLANRSELDLRLLGELHAGLLAELRDRPFRDGFLQKLYAPADDSSIRRGERVFYTTRNARYLDTARQLIEDMPAAQRPFFLAPLLSEASVHANTSGVFKGFYKDSGTGVGKFGGRKGDALQRILGAIDLPFPVFSAFECPYSVLRGDANALAPSVRGMDLAYVDPPYNQHPYGSNYFMLNLIADYAPPAEASAVSGIPMDWNRSAYNRRRAAAASLDALVSNLDASFVLVSFNSEGFILQPEMEALLSRHGRLSTLRRRYNTFRGSRNLKGRALHVDEYLFLLEKR